METDERLGEDDSVSGGLVKRRESCRIVLLQSHTVSKSHCPKQPRTWN